MTVHIRLYGSLDCAPKPRNERDATFLATLASRTGTVIAIDETVDYEDWMEPAAMLMAALDLGVEIKILPAQPLAQAMADPLFHVAGQSCPDVLIGRLRKTDTYDLQHIEMAWPQTVTNMANQYAELATFRRNAGRVCVLADMPGDPEAAGRGAHVLRDGIQSMALGDAMAQFAPGSIMVKQVYPAKALPLLSYDIPAGCTPAQCKSMFMDDVGFHFALYEGDKGALLVQGRITMTHETRFFVIDGKPVAAAACIEHHTPLQKSASGDMLDPIWEIARNSGEMDVSTEAERKALAQRMIDFATQVARDIQGECPELTSYVLDIALNADGDLIIIELNPAMNAGLYAIDAARYLGAILCASDGRDIDCAAFDPAVDEITVSNARLRETIQNARTSLMGETA